MENIPTILIADDDADYLFQIEHHLKRFGYKVIAANSQKETEILLQSIKPDLALFDLMMEQDDSGFILSYKLKKLYPDVPVIIATAVAFETGIAFSASDAGNGNWIKADRYLEKGVRPEQLRAEIEKLLQKKHQ